MINDKLKLLDILKRNKELSGICRNLKLLTREKENKEIEEIIKSLNLPFKYHLFILGNFSDLMSFEYE